jgi:23S rRNA pseudouridine1911/1915/1917 synthase
VADATFEKREHLIVCRSMYNGIMIPSHTATQPAELLAFLFAAHPQVKRVKVRQWLKFGAVEVNGRPITRAKAPLSPGDVVSIRPQAQQRAAGSLPRGLHIVFEDAALIVIEKPEGMLSMATATIRDKTAYAYLTNYVRAGNPRSRKRVWIVHRLDRETSGLMVFAKTQQAKQTLQENWPQAEKRYQAVLDGFLPAAQGVLSSHLNESGPYKVYSAEAGENTRHALTHYRVLQRTAALSLVELKLETGRRNQIRVQLADAGTAIVGDHKYQAQANPAGRLGLHATSLQFDHPLTGERLKFSSPLPPDLAKLLRQV